MSDDQKRARLASVVIALVVAVLTLLLGLWIGGSYMLAGVPPNEEDEATTLKLAASTLTIAGSIFAVIGWRLWRGVA
jgi:hypothetical protein